MGEYTIRFTNNDSGLVWGLRWRGVLIGAFTSEADADLFRSALERGVAPKTSSQRLQETDAY